ncbi:multiple epidermal growth factor-like domains protein 11, partial [Mercenaria mercenaria]|uniref:multiple epidermal growth factor-like domains protein 11 n=1 Tax=Mercenaria mercenaria TaxID=6596 RepID=UPI00234EADEA
MPKSIENKSGMDLNFSRKSEYEACDFTHFGYGCKNVCHCQNNAACSNDTGTCSSGGCAAGWQGDACDKVCSHGSYGQGCADACGLCMDNQTCDHVTGTCTSGCDIGYDNSDTLCNTSINLKPVIQRQMENVGIDVQKHACDATHFGLGCKTVCHCQNDAACRNDKGTCPSGGCAAGWQGDACDEECDYRTFGYNCSSYCHCRDNTSCDVISGKCDVGLCESGWQGSSCDTECVSGRFGHNCTSICHCKDGFACNHVTGICPTGCSSGWEGFNCLPV